MRLRPYEQELFFPVAWVAGRVSDVENGVRRRIRVYQLTLRVQGPK